MNNANRKNWRDDLTTSNGGIPRANFADQSQQQARRRNSKQRKWNSNRNGQAPRKFEQQQPSNGNWRQNGGPRNNWQNNQREPNANRVPPVFGVEQQQPQFQAQHQARQQNRNGYHSGQNFDGNIQDHRVRWKPNGFRGNNNESRNRNNHAKEGNERQNVNNAQKEEKDVIYEGGPLNLPGYMYNSVTKKYFKIADDNSGIHGYTRNDINQQRRERERAALFATNRPRMASGTFALRPVIRPISQIVEDFKLGRGSHSCVERRIAESRLLNCTTRPTFIAKTPDDYYHQVGGCEFLDVTPDGKKLFGCFRMRDLDRNAGNSFSSVYFVDAKIDDKLAQRNRAEKDRREDDGESEIYDLNTMGLTFSKSVIDDGTELRFTDTLVDMTLAPIDSDVTCLLVATARDNADDKGSMQTNCEVQLLPLPEVSSPESYETLSSPIYNMMWKNKSIWSVAWNSAQMNVSFGGEDCTRIQNVLTNKCFVISSRSKNVFSQQFSQDGNLLLMGLHMDDVIRSDLRMNGHHITGYLKGSRSTTYLKILKTSYPECIITENFTGQRGNLRMWDFRFPSHPVMEFKGHVNTHYRLPCFVDHKEQFLFAAGSDGIVRGWSLTSGDLLCNVPMPQPTEPQSHFPRAVFSDNWGGRQGNSALVVAVGDSLRVHTLDI